MLARMTSPHLTTVHQPFREMAARAVELLLAQVGQAATDQNAEFSNAADVFQAELIVRQTVGCVRK